MTQAKIVEKIRKLGYRVTVLNASARNRGGIPDVLLCLDGYPIFVEIKIDKDKLSKLQKDFGAEFFRTSFMLHYDPKKNIFTAYWTDFCNRELLAEFLNIKDKLNAL